MMDMMDEIQTKDEVVDLTLDRIFAAANAAEDRTAPSIDLDKLVAVAFADVDAEQRDVVNDVEKSPRQLDRTREGMLDSCTAGQILERMQNLRITLMRLVRHAWFDSSRARAALYLCAVYSLILMVSIGYDRAVLGILGSFAAGVIAAATGPEVIKKLAAELRYRRLIWTGKRLRHCAEHEPPKPSDTPIYDLTVGSILYQVTGASDQQRREFIAAPRDVPFLHVHETVEEPSGRDCTVHSMMGRRRFEVVTAYDDEKPRLHSRRTRTEAPWSCS